MVKLFFLISIFCLFFSCNNKEIDLERKLSMNQSILFLNSSSEVRKYFISNYEDYSVKINWHSTPPSDSEFLGLGDNGDTIIKISNALEFTEIITLNKTMFFTDSIVGVHFKGEGNVSVGHFPIVYHIIDKDEFYILEGIISGCSNTACKPFFVIIKNSH